MALEEYVGSIILEIDGQEIDIESLDDSIKTGRKIVKTMNSTGRPKGFAKGMADYDLKLTVAVPLSGEIDWAGITGAKITIYPQDATEKRVSFYDCFTLDVSSTYNVEGEAKRNITMQALKRQVE